MILGMAVLGMTFRAIQLAVFGTGFDAAWHEHTELAVFAMTFNLVPFCSARSRPMPCCRWRWR